MSAAVDPLVHVSSLLWESGPLPRAREAHAARLRQLLAGARAAHGAYLVGLEAGTTVLGADGGRELGSLTALVESADALQQLEGEIRDLDELAAEDTSELGQMAATEGSELKAKREALGVGLLKALMRRNEAADPTSGASADGAIVEIRAGTGGDEAALFAGDLFAMYIKYAKVKGWGVEELSVSRGEIGGLKEGILVTSP